MRETSSSLSALLFREELKTFKMILRVFLLVCLPNWLVLIYTCGEVNSNIKDNKIMKLNFLNRAFILSIIGIFLTNTFLSPVFAQSVLNLPQAGTMVKLSEAFQPSVLVGMKLFPDNPLKFDFILDEADSGL